jgi:hypothetical protein
MIRELRTLGYRARTWMPDGLTIFDPGSSGEREHSAVARQYFCLAGIRSFQAIRP